MAGTGQITSPLGDNPIRLGPTYDEYALEIYERVLRRSEALGDRIAAIQRLRPLPC